MRRPRLDAAALALAILLTGSCIGTTEPTDDFELPPPDTSLDPSRLVVGQYMATPCAFTAWGDQLAHLRDRREWALVDIAFGRSTAEEPDNGPSEDDVALVASHGGRVLYAFHLPIVRARMMLSRIPDLVREGYWITVREVPNAARYDVELSVGFTRPLADADTEMFESLGGRVTYRWEFTNAIAGVLPDRSIAHYQQRSDVEWVEANGVACLASEAHRRGFR